jgi:Uma2 family endonuclease
MTALPSLITVERFRNMPDDGRRYELHYGEVVEVAYPKQKYYDMQERLIEVLVARLPRSWKVSVEFPYRVWAEFELRFADVAVVSEARRAATDPEDNLHGAPELVIEVKSPSSTREELRELAALCLAKGSLEFWVVDLEGVSVTVIHRDGSASVFHIGQAIPLAAFGGDELPVEEVFG